MKSTTNTTRTTAHPKAEAGTGGHSRLWRFLEARLLRGAFLLLLAGAALAPRAGVASALFEEGLQADFRAEDTDLTGVPALDGAALARWRGAGAAQVTVHARAGGSGPKFAANGFTRADGTAVPAIRFTNVSADMMFTRDGEETQLGITKDSTWFLVFRTHETTKSKSVFGLADETARFGAFIIGTDNQFRSHNSGNVTTFTIPEQTPLLVSSRRRANTAATWLLGVGQGRATPTPALSAPSRFGIGGMLNGVPWCAKMDVGEIVIYNRALNEAERIIAENALAVKYGLALGANAVYAGADGFREEVVGVGCAAASAADAGDGCAVVSGWSGGLCLTALDDSVAADGEYLFAAHSGASARGAFDADLGGLRTARVWRFAKIGSDGMRVRVAFSFEKAGLGAVRAAACRLLYRADASRAFAVLPVAGVWDAAVGTVSFDLDEAQVRDGDYAFALDGDEAAGAADATGGARDGLTVWLRAADGVTLDSTDGAAVAAWRNKGSLGDAASVFAAGAGGVTLAESVARKAGLAEPALHFNGAGFLKTRETSTFGVQPNAGFAWFLVFRPETNAADHTVFGADIRTYRFGAFFPYGAPGKARTFAFNGGAYADVPVAKDQFQVLAMRAAPADAGFGYRAFVDGGAGASVPATSAPVPTAANLSVGHFNEDTWNKDFQGDIAELRVYNRTLNDAEQTIIRHHLAARHGVASDLPYYDGQTAAAGDYDLDVTGVGVSAQTGTGLVPGAFPVSADAGGLRLAIRNGRDGVSGAAFILFGHAGAAHAWTAADVDGAACTARFARDWRVSVSEEARGFGVRLTFARTAAGPAALADGEAFTLLRRTAPDGAFAVVPAAPVLVTDASVAFDLPGGALTAGYYTLGRGAGPAATPATPPPAGVAAGLHAWYRAREATPTTWRNLGTAGDALDLDAAAGAPTVHAAGFARAADAHEPSVSFNGDSYYESRLDTAFDVQNGVTWFAVMDVNATDAERSNMPVFGLVGDDPRFGAFFLNGGGTCRVHAFSKNGNATEQFNYDNAAVRTEPALLDMRRGAGGFVAHHNGTTIKQSAKTAALPPAASKFRLGHMVALKAKFKGELAELRVYNRALNDAETRIVQAHLAARYGLELTADAVYSGASAANGDYDLDVAGVGRLAAATAPAQAGGVAASDDSAGLSLRAVDALADGDFVLFGHKALSNRWVKDGGRVRWTRAWFVEKTGCAAAPTLRLRFSFAAAGLAPRAPEEKPAYRLLLKANDAAPFADAGVDAEPTPDGVCFTLSTDALPGPTGILTLGADVRSKGFALILR